MGSEASGSFLGAASDQPDGGDGLREANIKAFTDVHWRKSSRSSYNGNCVEVAELGGRLIGVRDTKDAGSGPLLVFGHAAWRSFLDGLKDG